MFSCQHVREQSSCPHCCLPVLSRSLLTCSTQIPRSFCLWAMSGHGVAKPESFHDLLKRHWDHLGSLSSISIVQDCLDVGDVRGLQRYHACYMSFSNQENGIQVWQRLMKQTCGECALELPQAVAHDQIRVMWSARKNSGLWGN